MPFLRLYGTEGQLQAQWPLDEGNTLNIGRARDNDVVLQHPEVSKYHARIEPQGAEHVLIDLDSANGVFVNGDRITRRPLAFWDEIRIYPYKLVYMARATLPGEEVGHATQGHLIAPQGATVAMSAVDVAALIARQQRPAKAYLVRSDSGVRMLLEKNAFSFGRARDSDLRCGGWFSPKQAAVIEHRADGDYLVPGERARVLIKGERRRDPMHLTDDTALEIQGVMLTYYFRPLEDTED